jgi:hypothetical protein
MATKDEFVALPATRAPARRGARLAPRSGTTVNPADLTPPAHPACAPN